jgi:hypothetical protein
MRGVGLGVTLCELGRVNCPFYFKVGACRHGDRCSRQHNKPLFSQTVLLAHMYQAPNTTTIQQGPTALATAADDKPAQEHFDDFYEEVSSFLHAQSLFAEIVSLCPAQWIP